MMFQLTFYGFADLGMDLLRRLVLLVRNANAVRLELFECLLNVLDGHINSSTGKTYHTMICTC